MIPAHIRKHLEEFYAEDDAEPLRIESTAPVGGGSINQAAVLKTNAGKLFVKWNRAGLYPDMFKAETFGLQALRETKTIYIPEVLFLYESETEQNTVNAFIVLEYLETKAGNSEDHFLAGKQLAALHQNSRIEQDKPVFGFMHDNYIGSLPQSNRSHFSWESFYAEERILPQVSMARNKGALNKQVVQQAEKFCQRIGEIFPPENSSLLHGDLWSGNMLITTKGPAVFDPAVYYGHREMDLAMTKLFGGFSDDFYAGYTETFAPEKNWKQRIDFCNLYPLLVHVNLFGGGYAQDVMQILKPFA